MEHALLSPKKIIKPTGGPFQVSFEVTVIENYTIDVLGIKVNKPIDTFYKSIPNGQFGATAPNVELLTEDIAEKYLGFQTIITHCVTNSEAINNQLRDFLLRVDELKQTKEEIMKMDFMTLRSTFSDFLNSYKDVHTQENFSTKAHRKSFTKFIHQFITDRNIYTHGALKILRPEEIFIIEYVENSKEKVRAEVDIEILGSFLQIGDLIRGLLSEISSFYYNRKQTAQKI